MNKLKRIISLVFFVFCLILGTFAEAKEKRSFLEAEETLLMFVGENLEVLEIASRQVESARQAPAVARVITRKELRNNGFVTLKDALETIPGFYMAQKEWGTQPYLRGIPDSILFLYDTVPLGSDTSKAYHPLDYELSMTGVKRIEIVRGPGSVLWGSDAFAGIVNVVPMTGKDINGFETGVFGGLPGNQRGFFTNWGGNGENWDLFLSVSGRKGEIDDRDYNLIGFWGDRIIPTPSADRYGIGESEDSEYLEGTARWSYNDMLTVSSRVTAYDKNYIMNSSSAGNTWREDSKNDTGYIRLETRLPLWNQSTIRMNGWYYWLAPELDVIDRTFQHTEKTWYGEIVFNWSLFENTGLFSGGVSFREKKVENAPIWDGFLLDFISPTNESFLPIVTQQDYSTRLKSLFAQYRHRIGNVDVWLGIRNDEHDAYEDNVSHSVGVVWTPSEEWQLKLLYGTAYRTPFARQLLDTTEPDLEQIRCTNLQVTWHPLEALELSATGFVSRIKDHIKEDPFAGLSVPNHQDFQGIELESSISPTRELDFTVNFTLIDNSGPDETYNYNDFQTVDEYGNIVKHFVELSYPYDTGPEKLFTARAEWRPNEKLTTSLRLQYISSRELVFPVVALEDSIISCSGVWLFHAAVTIHDLFFPDSDLRISLRNLFDETYVTPGTYSSIDGDPFEVGITVSKRW